MNVLWRPYGHTEYKMLPIKGGWRTEPAARDPHCTPAHLVQAERRASVPTGPVRLTHGKWAEARQSTPCTVHSVIPRHVAHLHGNHWLIHHTQTRESANGTRAGPRTITHMYATSDRWWRKITWSLPTICTGRAKQCVNTFTGTKCAN